MIVYLFIFAFVSLNSITYSASGKGNAGQTKTINEQIKSHSTPRNEIASRIQFTSAAMENPSIADLEMLQSVNSFSELLSGNVYLGSGLTSIVKLFSILVVHKK